MKFFGSILLLLFVFICCKQEVKKKDIVETKEFVETQYLVVGVKDGDTFSILKDGKEQTIRLAHIDCPEKNQPFGKAAKQMASDICFGKMISLKTDGTTDRNKRLIAEIIIDSLNVNKEFVRQGLAWHFKKYSSDSVYADLEIEARLNQVGLWSGPNPIAPWDWRKGKRD